MSHTRSPKISSPLLVLVQRYYGMHTINVLSLVLTIWCKRTLTRLKRKQWQNLKTVSEM